MAKHAHTHTRDDLVPNTHTHTHAHIRTHTRDDLVPKGAQMGGQVFESIKSVTA